MKLLCSDYDGTLCCHDGVHTVDLDAIRRFRTAGHRFAVLTGRTWGVIIDELCRWQIPYDYLVCNNGAVLVEGDRFVCRTIDPDIAVAMADYFKTLPVAYYGLSNGTDISQMTCRGEPGVAVYAASPRPLLSEREILSGGLVCGFYSIFKQLSDTTYAARQLKNRFGDYVEVLVSSDMSIDIAPKGVNKSYGVRCLIQQHPFDDIYAIGDSLNDLDMLKACNSFAIASGSLEIRSACDQVVNNVGECIDALLGDESAAVNS